MDWGDLDKKRRKKPKEFRSLTLRIPFSYKNVESSSSRRLTFKNHSSRMSVNYGVSKSSRRLILKRTAVTGNKMSSVSTNTVIVTRGRSDTSKTKGIRKRKRLESDEKLEGERVKVAKLVLSSATDAPMESAVVKPKSQTLHSFFSKAKKRTADFAEVNNEVKDGSPQKKASVTPVENNVPYNITVGNTITHDAPSNAMTTTVSPPTTTTGEACEHEKSCKGRPAAPPNLTPATSISTNTFVVVTRDQSDTSKTGDIRKKKRFHIQLDSDEDSEEEVVSPQAKVAMRVQHPSPLEPAVVGKKPPSRSGDDSKPTLIHAPDGKMIRSYGSAMHKKVLPAGKTKVLTATCDGKGCTYMSTCYDIAVQHEDACSLMPTTSIKVSLPKADRPSNKCSLSTCENRVSNSFNSPKKKRGTLTGPMCRYCIYCTQFRRVVYRDGKYMLQNPGDPKDWIEWPFQANFNPLLSNTPKAVPSWMIIEPDYAITGGQEKFLQAAEVIDEHRDIQKASAKRRDEALDAAEAVQSNSSQFCSYEGCEKRKNPEISHKMWCSVGAVVRGHGNDQCSDDLVEIDFCCNEHALERGSEVVDENNDIVNPYYIAGNTENEIHLQQVLSFDPSGTDRNLFPSSNTVTRFILQVGIVTELDMDCKADRERLHAIYKVFKVGHENHIKEAASYNRKRRDEAIAGNVATGSAPHLDDVETGRELQKSLLAQFHDEYSLVDCNKSSVQVDKDGNMDKVVANEHQRKARKTDSTPLLEDDGKGEGTGRIPSHDKVMILDDIRSKADFERLDQDIKRLSNMPDGPSVIVAAMYLCKPASQESVFKLEELAQYDVLSNEEIRHTSLNDDIYRSGNTSSMYNNYAIASTLLMKGAIKAVLDGKLYFNFYMSSDLKDRLRLMFPQLNDRKYWRREATNAREREKTRQAQRRDAKRQKTA